MSRQIKKLLLFNSPAFTLKGNIDICPFPPIGLAYIGAVAQSIGIEVKIYDALIEGWSMRQEVKPGVIRIGALENEIRGVIEDFKPDMVGVNNLFSKQRDNAHRVYALTKEVDPQIFTVAGGAHPTVAPELVMHDPNVDFVIIGEGEASFRNLIEQLHGQADFSSINGIAFRRNGIVKTSPKTSFIENLDSIPFPAWHLLDMDKYFGLNISHGKRRHRLFAPIVTSRGCPAGCAFCTAHHVWGRPFRKRSPENVIEEMRFLKREYGIRELMFEDDNVTLDVSRAEKLFDMMIDEKLGFEWDTPNGVAAFALNERLIRKMKDAGCYKLNIAVESGNPEVLKDIIKKPLDLKKVKPLLDYARSIGLEVGIFLIVGMPGEKLAQVWDSFRFAKEMGVYDAFVSVATPYPGSELYKQCREKGYIKEDYSFDNLYISSFSINTHDWNGEELRKVFLKGCLYLKKYYYLRHPFIFLRDFIRKMFNNPSALLRNCTIAFKAKGVYDGNLR